MRVLHFLQGRCDPDTANGVNKTAYFLARAQAASGAVVALFSISGKPPIPIDGVEVRTFNRRTALPFAVPSALLHALTAWRPDVVHLHSAYVPPNVRIAAWLRRCGIPYVITPNGVLAKDVAERRWWIKRPYQWLFERPLLQRSAFIHSVGDTEQIKAYGVDRPIIEAPNGIDLTTLPDPAELGHRRPKEWEGRTVALFVGRLDVLQKGIDRLLDAFGRAVQEESNLLLVLIGPDYKASSTEIRTQSAALGIADNVIIHGPEYGQRKYELLAAADFFVHLSRWEGLPFAVIEALALGRPCIVTAAADPAGLVRRSGAGVVVLPELEDSTRAILDLARLSPDERDVRGRAGRAIVRRDLQWPTIADRLLDGYLQHCGANDRR